MARYDMLAGVVGGVGGYVQEVDPTFLAARYSLRPLDYNMNGYSGGGYRAVSFSGAVNTISAAGILASLRWADASRTFKLLRLAVVTHISSAVTTATPIDVQAFLFRGSTGNASGSGSSTLTMTGQNQKIRTTMGTSLFATGGEIRTIGTTTALTAASGKTNDSAPFGFATFPSLLAVTATGTAVALPAGSGSPIGWQTLYSIENPYQAPIDLAANEGIEIQCKTATPTTGGIIYGFLWDWAELLQTAAGF